ncbi:hypothetical protein [Bacillus sp. 179-C3.3 HS]
MKANKKRDKEATGELHHMMAKSRVRKGVYRFLLLSLFEKN